MVYLTKSAEETEIIGKRLAASLEAEGIKRAAIAMRGELGVGKTAFTRGFASHFGISGVKSPTYTIVNEYRGRARLFHFDMYRITDENDLYSIGYDEYIEAEGYSVIEWSENIDSALPDDTLFVTIKRCEPFPDGREITIEAKYEDFSI
ncbi:MAG: tRNA (adenosine(37)-N6)-threonylcarbamoyltransferase complex ATPase subunit type 1 TsaE [Clostridia bacterium]|nr:tRNA (adenosine(37)-N6)-threonylcarbamoyltransferase complex ATPase subunit type 1 TsaE [Clostridia bacterium]MBO5316545.1 tRNA (adenosine(37)-N6)-threonylcarbamoyltransferase complex ATPase subunit type 1 TsaE [Clostridia bacterium]